MAKTGSKKRKITICIVSIVAVIALLFGACAVYLGDYYHAITPAGESFGLQGGSSLTETIKLDNGNIVCKSENATKGLIFYPGGKVEYTAYLPLMESLAQKGILCVLVRMPFNLAVLDVNAADGIRANSICPGPVESEMVDSRVPAAARWRRRISKNIRAILKVCCSSPHIRPPTSQAKI